MKVKCAETFAKRKPQFIVFHSRIDLEDNPIVHCMKELNYNSCYLEHWLKGVHFTVTVYRGYSKVWYKSRLGDVVREDIFPG